MTDPLKKIKIIHTVIWAVLAYMAVYTLYSGITGHITLFTWIAVGAVIIEGLILIINNRSCPLTIGARKYTTSGKDNFDIYLPDWLAKHNKLIFTTIFVMGILMIVFRLIYSL